MRRPIYMDYNATTPVDPRVVDAMLPCFLEQFGNAASRTHAYGWAAARLAERSRERIAAVLGAHPEELVFTSGATESNNLALKGAAWALRERESGARERGGHGGSGTPGGREEWRGTPRTRDRRNHIVTVATEHKAVLDPCARLAREGFDLTVLSVDRYGQVTAEQLAAAITEKTVLVSVMLANNETGTLQPIGALAAVCRERGVLMHCDATQAVGKIPVDAHALDVDLLSLSAHKVYGPKGVGALFIRRRRPSLRLVPIVDGGGHEQGLRSGTMNVPGVVGFASALELCAADMGEEAARLAALRDRLRDRVAAQLGGVLENGHPTERLPNTLNFSFEGVDGAALLAGVKEVAVSSGSACTSADPKPSHVLRALGRSKELANASLRFSLGRGNTEADVDVVADAVVREVTRLRAGSPLWRKPGSGLRAPGPGRTKG